MRNNSMKLLWRALQLRARAWRLRAVERQMRAAWLESKERAERDTYPAPERAAYIQARRELECWAWANGVPFEPFFYGRGDDCGVWI